MPQEAALNVPTFDHSSDVNAIRVEVLGMPVPKGRPRFSPTGHCYTPAKTRQWERSARWLVALAMRGRMPLTGPVRLRVVAVLPVPRSWTEKRRAAALAGAERPTGKPDADNIAKAASDGIEGIAFRSDSQVVEVVATKVYGDVPKVLIEVEPIGGAP